MTIGAEGEGMVAGDLVNTASRVQSVAEPGTVFVGESTRRATEQTIVYEDAGSFELKGKEGLTPLWRAQRVVSGLRGSLKSQGLEAPFVGRDRELRQIKDLFHASRRRAQGAPRLGDRHRRHRQVAARRGSSTSTSTASRTTVYWHRGRCLSYGEGVTYWALADMVRMRCRIAEEEEPASALAKLRATLEEHILDPEERGFLEPRLAHLLGLAEHQARDRQDLFAAWRLFFERLAESYPTVLAFEDMQWADASLLDFVEYLLDWSRSHPIFVITLARPELLERRPTWGAGQRSFTSLYLEPLSQQAMEELLTGLVPGLPAEVRDRILARAEGVPLYAVETVRMLLDRGLLVQDGPAYRLTGEVEALEVPETLHALIAARLDGLSAEERRLLQDAAVLGKTFTRDALAALSGSEADLEPLLASLVRKEVLGVQADPRSPEHGQYGFLQDLVRHVAYETLSKRERRARHLAAAEYLSAAFAADEDEVVEVIASHYLAAHEAAPDADDAAEIREQGAGDARARRGARRVARRGRRGEALLRAGGGARRGSAGAGGAARPRGRDGRREPAIPTSARRLFEESIALYEQQGDTHAAARVLCEARRGSTSSPGVATRRWRGWSARSRSSRPTSPTRISRSWPRGLALGYWFSGDLERAAERAELALDIAEAHAYPRPLALALRAKAAHRRRAGDTTRRPRRSSSSALEIALDHDLVEEAGTCYFILSDQCFRRDEYADALGYLDEALALARKLGNRPQEWAVLAERTYPLYMLGRWDEALAASDEFTQEQIDAGGVVLSLLQSGVEIHLQRGELDGARRVFSMFSRLEESTDVQELLELPRIAGRAAPGRRATRARRSPTARRRSRRARTLGIASQAVKQGIVEALEAAFASGEPAKVEELLALDRGRSPRHPAAVPRRPGEALPRAPRRRRDGFEAAAEQLPRARHPVLARRHTARARRADGRRGVARTRRARSSRSLRGDALARAARRCRLPARAEVTA